MSFYVSVTMQFLNVLQDFAFVLVRLDCGIFGSFGDIWNTRGIAAFFRGYTKSSCGQVDVCPFWAFCKDEDLI